MEKQKAKIKYQVDYTCDVPFGEDTHFISFVEHDNTKLFDTMKEAKGFIDKILDSNKCPSEHNTVWMMHTHHEEDRKYYTMQLHCGVCMKINGSCECKNMECTEECRMRKLFDYKIFKVICELKWVVEEIYENSKLDADE